MQRILLLDFKTSKPAFRGITLKVVGLVEQLTDQWSRDVDGLPTGSRDFQINLSITSMLPQLQNALDEIERISKNPKLLG